MRPTEWCSNIFWIYLEEKGDTAPCGLTERTWQDHYKLTAAGAAHTRLAKDKASQNSGMDGGGTHEITPLAEDPLSTDGC